MNPTLTADLLAGVNERLARANQAFVARYPGAGPARQPVHVVYGAADQFRPDTARRLGEEALAALERHAPDAASFARAIGLPERLAAPVHERVVAKLRREPVEDFRLDFEDGYGVRPDSIEDGHAVSAAQEVARGLATGTLPPFVGIRIKPLNEELKARSLRTVDLFLTALVRSAGRLPSGFVLTLTKITSAEQVAAFSEALALLEPRLGLAARSLVYELMIETTQSILAPGGECVLPRLVEASAGRCVACHFGVYDYTAGIEITALHQHMTHPACDFARGLVQVALAGTGVWLSDGATSVMPVGERDAVHRAWRLHFEHVRHSLVRAWYQGWDMHPAQLPTRFAAVYAFYLEGLPAASARLRAFVAKAEQATLVGEVFDDAATGQALLNFILRGLACGAITQAEALATGLTPEDLAGRSFLKVLERLRRG